MKPPNTLYKYCAVNANSLRSIIRAKAFYSHPIEFNDPLDCNPSLELNLSAIKLELLLKKMMEDLGATDAEVRSEIDRIAYFATEIDDYNDHNLFDAEFSCQLGREIMRLLRRDLGLKGVLSLAETWDDPLMWSHYADQHRGICIEYTVIDGDSARLEAVDYNAPRSISAQDIYRWKCEKDVAAEKQVFGAYFYAKANQWAYEKEWRDIADTAGSKHSNFDISAIHFGMRTDFVWKWTLVKSLQFDPHITLHEVSPEDTSFRLQRNEMSRDEIERRGIDRSAFKVFEDLQAEDINDHSIGERAVRFSKVGSGDKTKG
jgi:Protein of unknown function (DUF2971)